MLLFRGDYVNELISCFPLEVDYINEPVSCFA